MLCVPTFALLQEIGYKRRVTPQWKKRVRLALFIFGGVTCVVGVFFGFLSVSALLAGLYPEDGNGSLGHLGAVIAGIIGCFLTLISELLGVFMWQKARKMVI